MVKWEFVEQDKRECVNDREVLVMFVTPDGENIARNISEWYKTMVSLREVKKVKERTEKLRLE